MNGLENFYRMMEGNHPERLPFHLPMTGPVEEMTRLKMGRPSREAFNPDYHTAWNPVPHNSAAWREALEKIGFEFPPNSFVERYGFSHIKPSVESLGTATHLTQMLHPLSVVEDIRQLEQLPWPDPTKPVHMASACIDQAAMIHAHGNVAVAGLECTFFESTWYLRGMDNVFFDWVEENEISNWLLDYFTTRSIYEASAYARAGFDVIALGDDVGTQQCLLMSAEMWRQHLKPRLKRVIDAIRAASAKKVWVQYHSDGNITDLVEDLIEVGVDILNPVQPECMDVDALAAKVQNRIAFCGMIGTQTTMPFGTPDDVRAAVQNIARLHRAGARVVVAPTHVLEPDVPWENILAFVEAVKEIKFQTTVKSAT